MTSAGGTSGALRRFVDYFGELGQRWGLPAEACRVHAYLYVTAQPSAEEDIAAALGLEQTALQDAMAFLVDYRLVERTGTAGWRTGSDPWDLLARGLEQRRRRELPAALATLRDCHREALGDGVTGERAAGQIGKLLELVEDLALLDTGVRRLPPRLLRGFVGISGRAARFLDRTFRTSRGESA